MHCSFVTRLEEEGEKGGRMDTIRRARFNSGLSVTETPVTT
jgi:hypothetical protein